MNNTARKAFIDSLPVLMGYSTMGFAAGVLLSVKGGLDFPAFWAFVTSSVTISGALQFMMADWIPAATALLQVALLTFCLNVRYAMYGLSLLERFKRVPLFQRMYLIWGLTDETYALEVAGENPDPEKDRRYCLLLTFLNHFYWVAGVTAGAFAGSALPFSADGIDFAMTALFLVILTDQCREKQNRVPAVIGGVAAFICFLIFGKDNMLIPAIILVITVFLIFRRKLERKKAEQ